MFPSAISIFVLICINSVICEKRLCDIEDSKCVTDRSNQILAQIIAGDSSVAPSDPLYQDVIEANLPKLWLKLTNASLFGLIKCHLEVLKMSKNNLIQESIYKCPHLILDSEYEIKGELGSVFVEGKGTCRVDYYDYNLLLTGDYQIYIKNGKEHIHFNNTQTDFQHIEKVHYDFTNLFNGDKEKSDAALKTLNENWNMVDKPTHLAVLTPFMYKYLENINAYSDIVPLEVSFSAQ